MKKKVFQAVNKGVLLHFGILRCLLLKICSLLGFLFSFQINIHICTEEKLKIKKEKIKKKRGKDVSEPVQEDMGTKQSPRYGVYCATWRRVPGCTWWSESPTQPGGLSNCGWPCLNGLRGGGSNGTMDLGQPQRGLGSDGTTQGKCHLSWITII